MFDQAKKKNAVVKVGDGRGFVIEYRREVPGKPGERYFYDDRLVVTAAHCLPPRESVIFPGTFPLADLLGNLDGNPAVSVQCLFVDPVADIAVLGMSEDQGIPLDGYFAVTEQPEPLRIGKIAKEGREWKGWAWLPALDGEWVRVGTRFIGNGLLIEGTPKNSAGMSGSPILADDGMAIGVVSVGEETINSEGIVTHIESGPQPALAQCLSGWLL